MAEQNVVKMNEPDDGDGKKASTARCLSELVGVTMSKAAARLSSVDEDPIFREATVRAGIRDFTKALKQHFPELRDQLPEIIASAAAEMASGAGNTASKPAIRMRAAGGSPYADNQGPSGKSGG